jgi:hypothetical protein
MNASGQAMISINVDKRHRDIWKLSRLRREISSEAFIIHAKMKINLIKLKGNRVSPKNQEHNNNPYRATFAHQLLGEGEQTEVLEEDSMHNLENCIVFLWRKQGPHYEDLSDNYTKAERICCCCSNNSAKGSIQQIFILFTIYLSASSTLGIKAATFGFHHFNQSVLPLGASPIIHSTPI